MPFDSAPSPTIAPAETREAWRTVLLDAADYIDAHGWCQASLETERGEVCALGAMIRAAGSAPFGADRPTAYYQASRTFRSYIGSIAAFNNADGRTAAEVTAALRACAAQ